jgi:hypothetical protein
MFCSVKINYLYLSILKLKIMNDNVIYLLNVLRNYFNDLNENRNINDEELSILLENLIIDLKDLDRNIN